MSNLKAATNDAKYNALSNLFYDYIQDEEYTKDPLIAVQNNLSETQLQGYNEGEWVGFVMGFRLAMRLMTACAPEKMIMEDVA